MPSYDQVILADQPSYYWQLNEASGTTAIDTKGGANGTISGGVTLNQPGIAGKGMLFDGVSGKIVTSANVTVPVPLTFEFWLKSTVSGTIPIVGSQYPATATSDAIVCLLVAGGLQIQVYHSPDSVSGAVSCGGFNVFDGQWHHLVFICLGGVTGSIFVDGVAKGIISTFARPLVGISSKSIEIGYSNAFGVYYNGSIDEVAIYPYALSPAQISKHYFARFGISDPNSYAGKVIASGPSNYWRLGELSGTTAVDMVGGANSSINGGMTLNVPGAVSGNSAMAFDGLDDNVTIQPSIALPLTCTIEGWLKPPSPSGLRPMFSSYYGAGGTGQMISVGEQNGFPWAVIGQTDLTRYGTLPVPSGQWNHLVYVFDGANVTFYVNGALAGILPFARTIVNGGPYSYIGWYSGAMAGTGSIDEVAIYPRALTPAEILAHYNAQSYVALEADIQTIQSIPIGPSVTLRQGYVYALPGVGVQIHSGAILQTAFSPDGPWTDLATTIAEVGAPFVKCVTGSTTVTAHKSVSRKRR